MVAIIELPGCGRLPARVAPSRRKAGAGRAANHCLQRQGGVRAVRRASDAARARETLLHCRCARLCAAIHERAEWQSDEGRKAEVFQTFGMVGETTWLRMRCSSGA